MRRYHDAKTQAQRRRQEASTVLYPEVPLAGDAADQHIYANDARSHHARWSRQLAHACVSVGGGAVGGSSIPMPLTTHIIQPRVSLSMSSAIAAPSLGDGDVLVVLGSTPTARRRRPVSSRLGVSMGVVARGRFRAWLGRR